MEFGHWLSLTAVLLLGAMSPGPSVAVVIGNTMRGGASHGYLTAIGHGAGIALYAILTLAGLAAGGMTVQPAGDQLMNDLRGVGETMAAEWLEAAGDTGKAIVDAYTSN